MNNKFDEPIKGLARSVVVRLVCLALAVLASSRTFANDFRRGALLDLSDPDLLVACDSNGAEKESSIAVNPINPKNLVVAWIGGKGIAIGSAVSFDSGKRWQQIVIPGLSACSGGNQGFEGNSDPWLSFAPD